MSISDEDRDKEELLTRYLYEAVSLSPKPIYSLHFTVPEADPVAKIWALNGDTLRISN
jgi:hypothetical protein